jgi:hypothetical protein
LLSVVIDIVGTAGTGNASYESLKLWKDVMMPGFELSLGETPCPK